MVAVNEVVWLSDMVGHSISSQTKGGSAILHGGTRHAWLEVKDPKWEDHWVRLDATPAGDPNVDEEQQEEDLQARSRGVKDVPKELSDDLWRVKSDIDKEEQRVEESVRRDSRGEIFKAKRVEKEEEVLQKIQTLRQRYGGVLEECRRAWHAVVSKNLAKQQEEQDYTGPVPPDIGDELDEDSIVAIPIAQRSRDPLPLAFRAPQRKVTFDTVSGGYELYIGADVSLSMKDKDFTSGLRKCDAQRDAVFLFVDSIMQNVAETKRAGLLKDALPVRVCVATYAGDTSIVLPLTEQWGIDEQVKLYDALETFRSGTRDDITLRNFQKIMAESPSCDDSKMHRAILMFSDGGTQEQDSVRNEIAKMRIQGMVVAGFGITNEGRAMEAAYAPDGRTIENVEQLPDAGIRYIVNLLNTWYNT